MSFLVVAVVVAFQLISCNAQNFGTSNAVSAALGFGRVVQTDSETFTIDNAEFSRGLGSSFFNLLDSSRVNGSSISVSQAARGTQPNNISAYSSGFANSFAIGFNPQQTGIRATGASLIDTFATSDSAGLNGSAAVEAAVNGDGYIVFQNQAGGIALSQFGNATYNYTSRFNVSGQDATVGDFVNVLLVSNQEQVGSSLTLCQGSGSNCSVFTPGF